MGATTKKIKYFFSERVFSIKWDSGDVLINIFLGLIVLTLGYNLYNSYKKGLNNMNTIPAEEAAVLGLEQEGRELDDEVNYYSSPEYRRTYVRESQNYAEDGESLYYVVRSDEYEIDYYEVNTDPIRLDDNKYWWKTLILGN